MRWLFLLAICLAGVGLYRGWLSFSGPNHDREANKVDVVVSVDTEKLKADILAAKQRVDAAIVSQKPSETATANAPWLK